MKNAVNMAEDLSLHEAYFVLGFLSQRLDWKGRLGKKDMREATDKARAKFRKANGHDVSCPCHECGERR